MTNTQIYLFGAAVMGLWLLARAATSEKLQARLYRKEYTPASFLGFVALSAVLWPIVTPAVIYWKFSALFKTKGN